MEHTALTVAWVVLAYLLGSVPVGLLLSRRKGKDPRTVGSGNIGATNVMRAAGRTMGIVTLLGDILKGFLPTWLACCLGLAVPVVGVVGLSTFLGHLFPVYLRLKGGKGSATTLGVLLAFNPLAALIDIAVFALIVVRWRYVSLGSLVCAALMPVLLLCLQAPGSYVAFCTVMAVLIFVKHRANIGRLLAGRESRMGGE